MTDTAQTWPNYSGVSWHKAHRRWRAIIYFRGKYIYLGYYDDPEVAAWVVDTAKYLAHGSRIAVWPRQVDMPSFMPTIRDDIPVSEIAAKLEASGTISADELAEKTSEFTSLCASSS